MKSVSLAQVPIRVPPMGAEGAPPHRARQWPSTQT